MSHYTPQTHYEVLGVEPYADISEIKSAYKARALEIHPDKNGGTPKAKEAFQHLVNAYEVLSDVTKRRTYDQTLRPANFSLSWSAQLVAVGQPLSSSSSSERPNSWWNGYEEQVRKLQEMGEQARKRGEEEKRIREEMEELDRKRAEERQKAKPREKEKEKLYWGSVWN